MALVSQGYDLVVRLLDNGENAANLRFKLVAADEAAALSARTTILTRLAAVTDAVVGETSLIHVWQEDALALPGTGVHVEDRADVVCKIDGFASKSVTILIPAPKIGIFSNSSGPDANVIDPTDSDLLTYLDTWTSTGGLATLSDGETLVDSNIIREGRRTHRRSSFG